MTLCRGSRKASRCRAQGVPPPGLAPETQKAEFRESRLYPALSDLIRKHKELGQLHAELLAGKEQGSAVGLDLKRLRILRQTAGNHDGLDEYLETLIQRALPHLTLAIEEESSTT